MKILCNTQRRQAYIKMGGKTSFLNTKKSTQSNLEIQKRKGILFFTEIGQCSCLLNRFEVVHQPQIILSHLYRNNEYKSLENISVVAFPYSVRIGHPDAVIEKINRQNTSFYISTPVLRVLNSRKN